MKIATEQGLDRLFYELASESRLSILRTLETKNYRMQEIARRLDLTDTEAFRQLQRLSEVQLIQKQPDGAYTISEYGRLILRFSTSFEFAFKFKQCLLTRNIWLLPDQFINRLGELSQANLSTNNLEMINKLELLISNAEKYLWIIGERPLSFIDAKTFEKLQSGLSIRLLFDETGRKYFENLPEMKGVFEKKVIPVIPVTLVMNENFAGINLLSIDGRGDSVTFYGNDPKLVGWANDLFCYYWERGKHLYPA
jgi:predicted transcriptional regulator